MRSEVNEFFGIYQYKKTTDQCDQRLYVVEVLVETKLYRKADVKLNIRGLTKNVSLP